jgi:hypothetical protein
VRQDNPATVQDREYRAEIAVAKHEIGVVGSVRKELAQPVAVEEIGVDYVAADGKGGEHG